MIRQNVPQIFHFDNCEVRTIEKDGDVWFVAKDVAAILGYPLEPAQLQDAGKGEEGRSKDRPEKKGEAEARKEMNDSDRIALLMSYQQTPLVCSYIGAPCEFVGTQACADRSTITCRNIRQRNEAQHQQLSQEE